MARLVMVPGFVRKLEIMAAPMIRLATYQVARKAKGNINNNTGNLSRSVRTRIERRKGQVFIGTSYWRYYEYGTRPHIIRASTAKALSNGHVIFGKTVNHPGNRAFSPMRRALRQTRIY